MGAAGVALAALVRYALDSVLHQNAPLMVFVLPVLFAAAIGGARSGLVTTLLALVVGLCAFIPLEAWGNTLELARCAMFTAVGVSVSLICERLRGLHALAAQQQLAVANAEAQERAAERARAASERRFQMLLEGVPQLVWTCLPDGRCDYLSRQWVEYTGVPEAEQLGSGWADAIHPEDRERTLAEWNASVRTGQPLDVDFRIRSASGEYRWFKTRAVLFRDDTGTAKWFGTNTDVHDKRLASQQLRAANAVLEAKVAERTAALAESERRFRAIFHSQFQFIGLMTTDGTVIEANRTALAAVGVPESAVLNRPFWETAWWTHDAQQQERLKRAIATAAGGTQDRFEAHHITAAGGVGWVDFSLTPFRDEDGRVVLLIPEGRDITERKRMEAALGENEQRLRMATAAAGVGVWEWHIPTGRVKWNEQMFRMYGVPSSADGAVTYETWSSAVVPDDLPEQEAQLRELVARRGTGTRTFRIRLPDGSVRDIEAFETVRTGAAGAAEWVVGTNLDVTDRKRAEERLRAQEALLRQFIKHSPAAIAMLDTEMRYLQASDRWQADYGLSDGDILGRSHYEVFPEISGEWKAIHARVLAGAVERCDEDPFRRADGSTTWLQWECRPWYQPGGAIGGLIMFTQVITARKKAEAALRESEERFRSAFDNAAIGMALVSPEGRWLQVNHALCAILGYTESELLATDFQTITHPDDLEISLDRARQLRAGTIPSYQLEKRYRHKDGHTVHVLTAVSQVRDANGGPLYFVSQIKDVTERKATEAALRESEERFRAFMDHLPLAAWVVDAGGRITMANPYLARMANREPGAMVGKTRLELMDPASAAAHEAADCRVRETGTALELEESFVRHDGTLGTTFSVKFPVTGPDGTCSVGGVALDVTDRKRAEERVQASLREKESLLKEIHHRVKNNLQIVSALLDLQSDFTQDRAALAMFAESRGRVKSMALVHERLYKSHDVAHIDFGDYARQLAADLFRAYRASDDDVRLEVAVTAPPLPLDVAIPCGLLLNELMSNCFKHAFTGGRAGTLRVELTASGDARELVVADDGPGLPPGFDFRNCSSFGLQLVSALVDQLNGTMDARGPGAAFVVRFRTTVH